MAHHADGLTEEEAKLYDRQIRLWGVEAQNRMRNTKVLLVGFKSLNAEVCKNLVLAGVNSVTIVEHENASWADLGSHIFLEATDIGQNRAKASVRNISILNPLVKIECSEEGIQSKTEDFFKQFHVVCMTNSNRDELIRVDEICRKNSIFFFSADAFGQYSYYFADLGTYQYIRKTEGENPQSETVVAKYSSLQESLSPEQWPKLRRAPVLYFGLNFLLNYRSATGKFPQPSNEKEFLEQSHQLFATHKVDIKTVTDDFLRDLAKNANTEISPVCAITGGILAQDIIKVISGKDEAINNFFFYNPVSSRNPGETTKIPQ